VLTKERIREDARAPRRKYSVDSPAVSNVRLKWLMLR
jgi:hypothetical protein